MRKRVAYVLLALSAVVGGVDRTASQPPDGQTEREVWYVIRLSGAPVGIGWDHWVDADTVRYYENHVEFRVTRSDVPVTMVSHVEEWDKPDNSLLRFRSELTLSGRRTTTTGERDGEHIRLRTQGSGYDKEERVPWEDGAVGQASVDRYVRDQIEKGADEFSVRTFDPESNSFQTMRFRDKGTASAGSLRVVEQFEGDGEVPILVMWLYHDWTPQRIEMRQMGMEILIEQVSEEAIAKLDLDANFDIISGSQIPCEVYPMSPEELASVTFRLTFSAPVRNVDAFNGPNQQVLLAESNVIDLLVSREPVNTSRVDDEKRLRDYLKAARYIQSDHPGIQAVADSLVQASGERGYALAIALAEWVDGHIAEKSYGEGFTSAVDVLDARVGDCTEHSVLLAALLRAAGIPARVAVGLAYSEGHLIGHMWTEAYVDRWRTLDALDRSTSPIRIRIAVSPDHRAINETEVIGAYSLVGGLIAAIKDYQPLAP